MGLEKGGLDEQLSPSYLFPAELKRLLRLNTTLSRKCDFGKKIILTVLDVGSGPVSIVGRNWEECKSANVRITQLDPLANEYKRLVQESPRVAALRSREADDLGLPTSTAKRSRFDPVYVKGVAEYLPFQDGSFQLVYARNSIDHTSDPVKAIREMLRVARGCIVLLHMRNEGWHGQYHGWHNWNFDVDNEQHLLLWGGDGSRVDLTRYLEGYARVVTTVVPFGPDSGMKGIRGRRMVYSAICKL